MIQTANKQMSILSLNNTGHVFLFFIQNAFPFLAKPSHPIPDDSQIFLVVNIVLPLSKRLLKVAWLRRTSICIYVCMLCMEICKCACVYVCLYIQHCRHTFWNILSHRIQWNAAYMSSFAMQFPVVKIYTGLCLLSFSADSISGNTDWFDCGTHHACKVFSEPKNWHDAEAACNAEFGHLASIVSIAKDRDPIANKSAVCQCGFKVPH